ncbi:MAG: hypothetical protein KKD31_06240 [Bacteroidetes bacterium]|nr:hypothetical protein [Bacteroidota bacterium]
MKKIILIEDRKERQKEFLSESTLMELKNIEELFLPEEADCTRILSSINAKEMESLESYSLIIVHASRLDTNGFKALEEYCGKGKKYLILFSGGFSQTIYQEANFKLLRANSKDFYSDKLLQFLRKFIEQETVHLTELVYGDSWKLSFLLHYRHNKGILKNSPNGRRELELEEFGHSFNFDQINDIDKDINERILGL